MLDNDLAQLYGVDIRQLKRQVRRHIDRFPGDFMFTLTRAEYANLRCQFGTLRWGEHAKYLPYSFTEQGVAMLSGLLNSPRAVAVNIAIMRAFVNLRRMIASNEGLARKLAELETRYDAQFKVVFDAIRELMEPPEDSPAEIGFKP